MAGSEEQNADIESSLKEWFSGADRVVVAGIGNPFRRDDFVGVEIVRNLQNKVSKSVFLIEAETVPESFMQQITGFNAHARKTETDNLKYRVSLKWLT